MKQIQPAIFLDRDGVINNDDDYVYKIADFQFIDGVFDACQIFKAQGYQIIIITNQAGIARGFYSEQDFQQLTQWMQQQFQEQGIAISGVYYCPHHPVHGKDKYLADCQCRKPEPGMILQAAGEHDIELSKSILIGDKISDINAGKNAGIGKNYLVKTGKTVTDEVAKQSDGVFNDLLSLAQALFPKTILERTEKIKL